MNYKDHFKQQLINEMAMTGRAYHRAVDGWRSRGKKTREGMNILRKIHSDDIYDLDDSGSIEKTGDLVPPMMGIHGILGGDARDRQAEARLGRRVQRAGRDADYNRDELNAFNRYMASKVKPEHDEEIMNTLDKYPTGIVGGIGGYDDGYLEAPGAGWRINKTSGRYKWKPKDIGGVGGDELFNAFS